MEIKIIKISDWVSERHILAAIVEGDTYSPEVGITLTVTGNHYHLTGTKVVRNYHTNELETVTLDEAGLFARKVWKVFTVNNDTGNFQPIATFDSLEAAYTAATQESIHPICNVVDWKRIDGELQPINISPSKSVYGFFVQEAWV